MSFDIGFDTILLLRATIIQSDRMYISLLLLLLLHCCFTSTVNI